MARSLLSAPGTASTAPRTRRPLPLSVVILMILILGSAFAVIQSSHQCRKLYAVLQQLEADQWYLQEDYGRLLLEQSTWASHYRVERVATRELGMQAPSLQELKVVKP